MADTQNRAEIAPPLLILASGSPRRRSLLAEAGYHFVVEPSPAEEIDDPALDVVTLTRTNAEIKADGLDCVTDYEDPVVLAADTLVAIDGEALGKPADLEAAARMIARLNGRTHEVLTGVCLRHPASGASESFVVRTAVTFKQLSDTELAAYHQLIDPLDKAGAYAAQEHGEKIIASVQGSWTNVVGLPMDETAEALRRLGVTPAEN